MSLINLRTAGVLIAVLAIATLAGAVVAGSVAAEPGDQNPDLLQTDVWGKVQMENSCYVRLPDIPAGRYGGHGGYNPDTHVLAYVGGAEKATDDNTIAHYPMYAIKLDGTEDRWSTINYSANLGYTRDNDRGCREMSSTQYGGPGSVESGGQTWWISVGGKDGCDGTEENTGSKAGDIKMIKVGSESNSQQVNFINSKVDVGSLTQELEDNKFKLLRNFSTWDSKRDRLIFGQGTFDDTKDTETQDEIYQATRSGSNWRVKKLNPGQPVPSSRFSSCAAYVPEADGVIVLGGQQGGEVDTTSYKEVWWLDFSGGDQGKWVDITSRFTNMDAIGYRRGGACAYDADTKTYYTWMGRANASIPDGNKRSAGFWKFDATNIADENADLTWVRLAKDKQTELEGRRLIPSVWDNTNKRFFAIGGRNGIDEWTDVWALYPEAQCDSVNPVPPTPTPTTAPPTNTPKPTDDPSVATPTSAPPTQIPGDVCDIASAKVPTSVINDAVANPGSYYGYDLACNPNLPVGEFNPLRRMLSMSQPNKPFHPLYNSVQWKCGCP